MEAGRTAQGGSAGRHRGCWECGKYEEAGLGRGLLEARIWTETVGAVSVWLASVSLCVEWGGYQSLYR